MYRIIEKINGVSKFYVQKKYGYFWLNILGIFGIILFSSIFFVVLSIIFFLYGINFSNGFPVGMIPLSIGLMIIGIGIIPINDYRIFIKFYSLSDSREYIEDKLEDKKNRLERKTVVHYMSESDERAEKLRKIKRKKIF